MANNKTQGNQSGEKLLAILEYMAMQDCPQKLMDIAKALDMNNATALRYLTTLVHCGYVDQDKDTSRYMITLKLCTIAAQVNREDGLRRILYPYMQRISEVFGESVCLAVNQHDRVVYIEILRVKNQSLMTVQTVGNSAPMYCNGIGKLFLSTYDDERLAQYLKETEREKYTEFTITDEDALKRELALTRQRGYAYDEQEKEIGARCVAFPVIDANGEMVAGISVTGPYSRLTDELINPKIEEFRRIVKEASERI